MNALRDIVARNARGEATGVWSLCSAHPAVVESAMREARDAGVWVFGAGLDHQDPSVVATDGTVTDGPYPESKEHIGGFAVVDVASRDEALIWAGKIAAACRCAQQVFELLPDDAYAE